jgi:hypothetical protein
LLSLPHLIDIIVLIDDISLDPLFPLHHFKINPPFQSKENQRISSNFEIFNTELTVGEFQLVDAIVDAAEQVVFMIEDDVLGVETVRGGQGQGFSFFEVEFIAVVEDGAAVVYLFAVVVESPGADQIISVAVDGDSQFLDLLQSAQIENS